MTQSLTVIQILPALNSGGVERGTTEIAKALVDAGYKSYVISAGGRLVEQLEREGTTHIALPVGEKRLSTLKYIWQLRKLFREIKPDIIHLRSRLPAWIAYLAWRKLPKADRPHIVTTVHGPYSINRYSAIMTVGDRVIAVSNMIKGYIIDNYSDVNPNKISVIHRGIDTLRYNKDYHPQQDWLQQWKADFPQLTGKLVLTLPARITAWKGQDDFISCIKQLKQHGLTVHGLIVGETHPRKQGFLTELQQRIQNLGLDNDITFTGHRTDIQNILAVSDIVFSLAKQPEAFGRTTIEALSMGIPVIGYNHGGVAEQLNTLLPEGLVDINDVDAVVNKVIFWQHKPPIVGNDHPFTLQLMCEKTVTIYHELCEDTQ
ncbi:MAG: glycosyltransferase family 4 protein [Gammaproteobacteria bacterium]|nr:glycosyltransferase family 4 protein [Gammaproteobacteria bacterium]